MGDTEIINAKPVHTIVKGVATDKDGIKKDADKKYNLLTSRKYFTSTLAVQISAYEADRMAKGLPVGAWTETCSHQVKAAIKSGAKKVYTDVTYRDNTKETFISLTAKHGYMKKDGEIVIHPHQKRWIRMFNCGSKIEKLVNDKGEVFYESKNHDCGDKLCMRCNKKKSFLDFMRYKNVIMSEIEDPVMLVLHGRSPKSGELDAYMKDFYGSLDRLRKQNSKDAKKGKCEKWSYYWSFEMTINALDGSFHPHYHLIISQSQAKDLMNKWIEDDPKNRSRSAHEKQKLEVITSEDELIEVFKYATKISQDVIDENGNVVKKPLTEDQVKKNQKPRNKQVMAPIPMIYEMLMSIYRIHRNGAVGSIYTNRKKCSETKKEIIEKVKEAIRKDGFDVTDNPIIELADTWKFDYKRGNYYGVYDGVEFKLSNFRPSNALKEFLRIKTKPN